MATTKLTTDRQIEALKPRSTPYEHPVALSKNPVRGLIIRVFPSGRRIFEFRYVAPNGKRRRLSIGSYPEKSLADAGVTARRYARQLDDREDPAAIIAAETAEKRTGDTLKQLAEAYFTACTKGLHGGRKRAKAESTIAVEQTRFRVHIEPELGKRRFKEIRRVHVKEFMRDLASGDLSANTVASIGRTLSAIFAYAVHEDALEANPMLGLTQPLATPSRDRMFSDETLGKLWAALSKVPNVPMVEVRRQRALRSTKRGDDLAGLGHNGPPEPIGCADPVVAHALKFALLTLARRGDVTGAQWAEINRADKTWTIPKERFKSRRAHIVPLSATAIEVLEAMVPFASGTGGYIFPSQVRGLQGEERPLDAHSLTRSLTRTLADLTLPHGSPHDFRRSGATTLTSERYGFRRFIVGMVLGHSEKDGAAVTGVYDRNEYLSDKRAALAAWERHLLSLAEERASV